MSRIRTIKPDFWTDSLMVQMPALVRLLYIGIWTAADDHGSLADEPDRICMEVMPREDAASVEAMIDLLIACGRLSRMVAADGSTYLQVDKWEKHQRVDKPSKSRFPRESSRKAAIPAEARRKVAQKYGCEPGGEKDVACYFCGQPGSIWWPKLNSGRPSGWVAFSGVELDHLHPEVMGGDTDAENLVLSCRACNRGRRDRTMFEFAAKLSGSLESSRGLMEGKEGKGTGKEEERGGADAPTGFAFVGKVVRLTVEDFGRWAAAYDAVPDLMAELTKADAYYSENPPADGKWFFPVSKWLDRAHADALKAKVDPDEKIYRGVH